MTKVEANLEVEVAGVGKSRTNYLEDDEVLTVKKGDTIITSVFGNCVPVNLSLTHKASSGGIFFWDENGRSIKGRTLSGQVIPIGGLSIRPEDIIEIELKAGVEVEIGIAGTGKSKYQMFDDLGTAQKGDILRVKGVGVNVTT